MTKDLLQRTRIYSLRKFKGVGLASAVVGAVIFGTILPHEVKGAETDPTGSNVTA